MWATNSSGLAGHISRKWGRMWHNVLSVSTWEQLSSSHFFTSCACALHQPTQFELEEYKSVAAIGGIKIGKNVGKSAIFSKEISPAVILTQVFPALYSFLSDSHLGHLFWTSCHFFPIGYLVRRNEPKPAVNIWLTPSSVAPSEIFSHQRWLTLLPLLIVAPMV